MNFGVFVGRFCPIHLGHEAVIRSMISECTVERSLVIVGSTNHRQTMRHFFSYSERRDFIKKVFPDIKVMGLADFKSDDRWLSALKKLHASFSPLFAPPFQTQYFGGCEEDIQFFLDRNLPTRIINRFDGSAPKISATEVRDALVRDRLLNNLLNPLIADDVKKLFDEKWEKFKRI